MKRLLGFVLAMTLLTIPLAGCNANYNTLSKVKDNGKIVYYTDAMWAPFEYIGEAGQPVGVDVDIAKKIAEKIGVELEIVNASFDGIAPALKSGTADMAIAAITITEDRQGEMDFSDPYAVAYQNIVLMQEDTATTTFEGLAGKRIGVHLGTTGDFMVTDEISDGVLKDTGATAVQYKSLQEACLAMLSGNLDAIVVDDFLARNLVVVNPGLKNIEAKFADGTLEPEPYGVAIAKGNSTLVKAVNEVLAEMKAAGEIDKSLDYHIQNATLKE